MDVEQARLALAAYDPARYYRYPEMTDLLRALAVRYPDLCRLESLGTSPEGRSIWSVTVTRFATGPDSAKPGYQVIANHHAAEVATSSVALYTLKYLLERYGQDPDVTALLDTRAIYVLPRLTVDGTEFFFDQPQFLRSSPLLWPFPEEQEGFVPADVDGDGRVLTMRVPDPLGEWTPSARDPRLLVRRRPDDRAGPFYRVLTEGVYRDRQPGAGLAPARVAGRGPAALPGLAPAPQPRALDFNRQYPANWRPHGRQPRAGPFPFSQPETRALAEFVQAHPNLCAALSHHTYGGVLLRPLCLDPDEKLPPADLAAFRFLGELGQELTGHPCVSVYHDFQAGRKRDDLDVGTWLEWAYEQMGWAAFETELWAWPYVAGVPRRPLRDWPKLTEAEREQDGLRALRFVDEELDGFGFHPWRPVEHPQLGPVEVGGWDTRWLVYNPPPRFLAEECRKYALFTVRHALATPLLAIGEVAVTSAGAGVYRVAARVENRGLLPARATAMAGRVLPGLKLAVTLELPEGVRLAAGRARHELADLAGALSASRSGWSTATPAENFRWVEWVVQAPTGGARLQVRAAHPRAGTAVREVTLPG